MGKGSRYPVRETLKELRQNARLTQESFADMLGMSQNTYAYKENGERKITVEEAMRIAYALGRSVEDVFSKEIDKFP